MSLASKAPPRKSSAPRNTGQRAQVAQADVRTVTQKRNHGILNLAQVAQGLCLMTGQYADAAAIGHHFPPIAQEVANLCDSYDVLAKPIDILIETGPFAALITAALPFGLQLMANHGKIDASRLMNQGVLPPAVLEAQMQAHVAQLQAEAMKAQRQALMEAENARRESEQMMKEYERVVRESMADAAG